MGCGLPKQRVTRTAKDPVKLAASCYSPVESVTTETK